MPVRVRGNGVKDLRTAAAMTSREFGELMEVNASTVIRWENDAMGMTEDHFEMLKGLSEVYEVDLEKLSE